MSKMLWNPTNENLSYAFGGITFFFNPGEKRKVEDAAGKHLLHNLGIRGLTVLDYDCDEKKIGADAIERNRDFKKKMVVDYNQRNETRKQTNFPYLAPTKEVKAYAIELGMGLLEPFTPRDPEREGMASMQAEISALKRIIEGLSKNMAMGQENVKEYTPAKEDLNQKVPKQRGA